MLMKRKITIIGSGISSLSAACYLAKAGNQVIIFEKNIVLVDAQNKYTKTVLFSTLVPHGIGCQMFLKSFSLTLEKNQVIIIS